MELLHIGQENTRTKAQKTLDFKLNKPNQNSSSHEPSLIPAKWLMGWRIYKFIKSLTKKVEDIKLRADYTWFFRFYEREPVDFENVKKAQKTVEHTLRTEINLAIKIENEKRTKTEYGFQNNILWKIENNTKWLS